MIGKKFRRRSEILKMSKIKLKNIRRYNRIYKRMKNGLKVKNLSKDVALRYIKNL